MITLFVAIMLVNTLIAAVAVGLTAFALVGTARRSVRGPAVAALVP